MAKNLLSDIAETVRDGEAMMDVVLVDQTEAPTSPLRDMSILRQRPFLRHVVRMRYKRGWRSHEFLTKNGGLRFILNDPVRSGGGAGEP